MKHHGTSKKNAQSPVQSTPCTDLTNELPNYTALYKILSPASSGAWKALQAADFIKLFHQQAQRHDDFPHCAQWPCTAMGLLGFCQRSNGLGKDLLSHVLCILLMLRTKRPDYNKSFTEETRKAILAICSCAVERWVHDMDCTLKLLPEDLGDGILVPFTEKRAVYFISASRCNFNTSLPSNLQDDPKELLHAPAPFEYITEDEFLQPAFEALHGYVMGTQAVTNQSFQRPKATSFTTGYIKNMLQKVKPQSLNQPMFAVDEGANKIALHQIKVRQHMFKEFNVPTVIYGSKNACENALQDFGKDLCQMLEDIHQLLCQTERNVMTTEDQKPNTASPSITVHVAGSVGAIGAHAQGALALSGGQAAVGNINNQTALGPEFSAAFNSLLAAFLQEAQTSVELTAKQQARVVEHLQELQTLASKTEANADVSAEVQAVVTNLDVMLDGAEKTGKLFGYFLKAKDYVAQAWPSLAEWIKGLGGQA